MKDRHNQIVDAVADEFRQLGFDVVRSGYEAGGQPYDPDLFVRQPAGGIGFYIEVKTPIAPNIAIDLDEWLRFRVLGDVLVLAVLAAGRCAVLDIDRDRPLFWGAAADDLIPVVVAEHLRVLDVPLRLFDRCDPSYTSNKPFIIYRPQHTYKTLELALAGVLRKAGIRSG